MYDRVRRSFSTPTGSPWKGAASSSRSRPTSGSEAIAPLFAGGIALVGLSQVRETATFGGLPLMERLDERLCGVWAVDPKSGNVLGFLRFEELVQEVDCLIAELEAINPDEFNTSDGRFTLAEGAWFNARLGALPGTPIHNPFMAEQLLTASIAAFEEEYGVSCPSSSVSLARILR